MVLLEGNDQANTVWGKKGIYFAKYFSPHRLDQHILKALLERVLVYME